MGRHRLHPRHPLLSIPGHEIVGKVHSIGADVSKFKPGDLVAVGTMVDSCKECDNCKAGLEPYCLRYATWTYNAPDRITGENTLGGYSDSIVVNEDFVLRITHPEKDLAAVAPLLCAGVTMWSPLRHWNAGPGKRVGIVGIGGLGHMGIRLAHALGAHVVAFTTSENKRRDALALGADEVVVSRNPDEMAAHAASLDLIINTGAAKHNLNPFLNLLRLDGTMALVGIPAEDHPSSSVAGLIGLRRNLSGSLVGGIAETQELLDFCAKHNASPTLSSRLSRKSSPPSIASPPATSNTASSSTSARSSSPSRSPARIHVHETITIENHTT